VSAEARDPDAPASPVIELGLGVAWLVGIAATLQIVDRLLPEAALGTVVIGAVLVDFLAGRAGVRWNEEREAEKPVDYPALARRVLRGAGIALGAGLAVIALSAALGFLDRHGEPVRLDTAVLLALVRAAAVGVRDELLYRGVPLAAAARAGIPAPAARVFAALTGAAAVALQPGVSAAGIALALGSGWLSASLWQSRGAFAAVGARAAWILLFGSLLHGGLFDVHWHAGNLTIGNTSWGAPAWLAAAALGIAGALVGRRRR
jgi:hypothetical protein